jgi:hypothetical protein
VDLFHSWAFEPTAASWTAAFYPAWRARKRPGKKREPRGAPGAARRLRDGERSTAKNEGKTAMKITIFFDLARLSVRVLNLLPRGAGALLAKLDDC